MKATGPAAVVVAGASAGGVEPLRTLVAGLPADLDAAVLIVLHVPRDSSSALPAILSRCGPLPASHAVDGEHLMSGRVLVAPPDHHLIVSDGRVRLSRGPTENGHRPAVDPLFRSVARAWRDRAVGIVLSGSRNDGTSGAIAIADAGGTVFVQDSGEALHPSMPRSVEEHVTAAVAVPVTAMGEAVSKAVEAMRPTGSGWHPGADGRNDLLARETAIAIMADVTIDESNARPAGFGCPHCHGALFEIPGEPAPRFRCRVGHAWTGDTLLDEQGAAMEGALWMALRSLEEKAALSHQMAEAARQRGSGLAAERYDAAGADNLQASRLIRRLIDQMAPDPDDER
jgi:two-component system chemotaxis response regulator CheB